MKTVVFACVHNAGLSQMAQALFNRLADTSRVSAVSGGPHPHRRVYPAVVEAMREVGIDLSTIRPRYLAHEIVEQAQLLVALGCGDECPFVPGLRRVDWPVRDPREQPMEVVRGIRDELAALVKRLIEAEGWGPGEGVPSSGSTPSGRA